MAIQRIVRMTFKAENCDEFESFFTEIKDQIVAQPGCHEVRLLRELGDSGVFFTYSIWDNQTHLDAYRNTALFNMVWPKVRQWFDQKPEAWSTELLTKVN
jgi:quinol monooxygenase YgiN